MSSLSGVGVPVVAKTSSSFRKRDVKITQTLSNTDVVTTRESFRDDIQRPITSGSIVRDNGAVVYRQDLVFGDNWMSRNSDTRIASSDLTKVRTVKLDSNHDSLVIPTGLGLVGANAQKDVVHTGHKVVRRNSGNVGDPLIDRAPNSGVYS